MSLSKNYTLTTSKCLDKKQLHKGLSDDALLIFLEFYLNFYLTYMIWLMKILIEKTILFAFWAYVKQSYMLKVRILLVKLTALEWGLSNKYDRVRVMKLFQLGKQLRKDSQLTDIMLSKSMFRLTKRKLVMWTEAAWFHSLI